MELGPGVEDSTDPYVKMCFAIICAGQANVNWRLGNLKPLSKLLAPYLMATSA